MNFGTIGKKEGLFELIEIPEKFGPLNYPIDDHKIKTYAFTQNDYHPWYFNNDTPFGKRIAHSSILANDLLSLFLTVYDPNSIIGLHTQEELWFYNPVYAGENVTLQGEYVDKYERRNKGYVVMEAEARGEDGRLLVKHRGIEIMRIHGGSVAAKRTATVEGDIVTGEYDKSIKPADKATNDITVGTPVSPLVKNTSMEQAAVYSWIGKYFENIHNNIHKAQKAGFELPVVQGQQQVGFITEFLTNFFGASWFTSGWEKVKMIRPVLVGEVITVRGLVKDKTVENGKTKLHLHVWIENEKGEMTIIGWASAYVE